MKKILIAVATTLMLTGSAVAQECHLVEDFTQGTFSQWTHEHTVVFSEPNQPVQSIEIFDNKPDVDGPDEELIVGFFSNGCWTGHESTTTRRELEEALASLESQE